MRERAVVSRETLISLYFYGFDGYGRWASHIYFFWKRKTLAESKRLRLDGLHGYALHMCCQELFLHLSLNFIFILTFSALLGSSLAVYFQNLSLLLARRSELQTVLIIFLALKGA